MNDLISRQAAIDAIEAEKIKHGNYLTSSYVGYEMAEKVVKQLQPIQPEPHTGHWEPVGMAEVVGGESAMWGSAIAYHVCSECWEQALEEDGEEKLSDFCPHCGAKMEVTE